MFGLFRKKTYKPNLTLEDKDWVEQSFIWFIQLFGLEKLREQPFILPTIKIFPYNNFNNTDQFQKLFEQLCKYWDLNPNEISVNFFDDFKSKQWTTWIPHGEINEPAGLYSQINTENEKRFNIQLAKSNLNNPQLLVSVISHELAHVKLLGENYIDENRPDMEPLTDLASIYFGFGIFVANSVLTKDIYWINRLGYLPDQLISYANALICYITEHDAKNYTAFLNTNTKELFEKDFEFLSKTNKTALTKRLVLEVELSFKIRKQLNDGLAERKFDQVIDACNQLLETDPKNSIVFNNLGYALLQKKQYKEAINQFTTAIKIDPYWDYPYNNRGYCKLQLGDIENAFVDIYSSFEMNPDNSFSRRNLGAYYLKKNEFEKALQYFEEAEKMDPKTELINFYLGQVYLKMGSTEKSNFYMDKSLELNEYNDSIIE